MLAKLEPYRTLLLQAADTIERHGLAKHVLQDRETGAYCANGAINVSCPRNEPYRTLWAYPSSPPEEYKLALVALAKAVGWDYEYWMHVDQTPVYGNQPDSVFFSEPHEIATLYIANWNNAPGRTQAEVVAKLREVAYAT